jgi:hypothetical protein
MSRTDPPSPKGFGETGPPSDKGFGETGPHNASAGEVPHAGHDHQSLDLDVARDTTDVDVRALVGFAVGLMVVSAVVMVLMYGLFRYFTREAAQNDPPVSRLARPPVEMPRSTAGNPFFGQAQGPQLITHEPSVLAKQRKTEQDVLDSYGWVDQKSAIARMPISEAKKLILQRGLPARADGMDPSLGTRRAAFGESSSGRAITHPPAAAGAAQEPPAAAPAHAVPEQAPKGHGQ